MYTTTIRYLYETGVCFICLYKHTYLKSVIYIKYDIIFQTRIIFLLFTYDKPLDGISEPTGDF